MKKEGPTTNTFTVTNTTCFDCKYHESNLMKSGKDPIYNHFCLHPESTETNENYTPLYLLLDDIKKVYIGKSSTTPEWCPFLKNKKS